MTSANGSLDFLRMEFCVGTALIVDRIYLEGQLDVGEAVTAVYDRSIPDIEVRTICLGLTLGGILIGGGGRSSSETLNG